MNIVGLGGLLNGRCQAAVLEHRASRFVKQTPKSENVHFDFFSIFAQVSRNATVLLNTGRPEVESRSTQK